jgi:multisubunit Na+/H+ antiporter MnhG subunit
VIREVITDVLLALAVLVVAASAIGVAIMPNAYARLHYVTPAAVVAPVLVALAVFVTEGLDENTGETVVALVFMIAAAPFLSHATIRAIRVREAGDWRGHPPAGDTQDTGPTRGTGGTEDTGNRRSGRTRARESR